MRQGRTVKSYVEENCPEGYLTAQQYAAKIGYSSTGVIYAAQEGRLEHVRIGRYFYVKEGAEITYKSNKDGRPRYACKAEIQKWKQEYKYTTDEVAKANGVTKARIGQLRATGRLDSVKIGGRYLHKTTDIGPKLNTYFVQPKSTIALYIPRAAVFAYIEDKGLTEDMLQWVLARVRGREIYDATH